jgi:O-antigen ligase
LLIAWSVQLARTRQQPEIGLRRTWPYIVGFLVVAGWTAVQASASAPVVWHHPLWDSAANALGMDISGRISLDPRDTLSALTPLLTYGGVFWLALQYGQDRDRAWRGIFILCLAGLAYAAYGLAIQLTGLSMVLWYDKVAYENNLTSTFVNRNSYATYAGLGLLSTTALLVKLVLDSLAVSSSRREKLRRLLEEKISVRGWILFLAWAAIATALLLTHSRAGFVSSMLGMLVLILALGFTRAVKARYAALIGTLPLIAGIYSFSFSGNLTAKRLMATVLENEQRLEVYELTLDAIEAAPLLGTGYGSFQEVFSLYRTQDIQSMYFKAHSTYLENALELGIPAALALIGVIAGLFLLNLRGLRRRRRDAIYPCLGASATVLVAAHSIPDFSLQIPAVAITYSFIMGICCAQSWSSRIPSDPW